MNGWTCSSEVILLSKISVLHQSIYDGMAIREPGFSIYNKNIGDNNKNNNNTITNNIISSLNYLTSHSVSNNILENYYLF